MSLAASILVIGAFCSPLPRDQVANAVERALEETGAQREIPGARPSPERGGDAGRSGSGSHDGRPADPREYDPPSSYDGSSRPRSEPPTRGAGSFASLLLWTTVAIVAGFLALAVAREVRARRAESARLAPSSQARTLVAAASGPIGDADALAVEGRFDEAAHALLLAAVARLRAEGRPPPLAWTSREVAQRVELDPARRSAMSTLVLAVERSEFGGQALGAGDWEEARRAYAVVSADGIA